MQENDERDEADEQRYGGRSGSRTRRRPRGGVRHMVARITFSCQLPELRKITTVNGHISSEMGRKVKGLVCEPDTGVKSSA